jgi:hypothetical protein
MTKNGLRIPCFCTKCGGASKDYRTVDAHARREEADRPLFRAPIDLPEITHDDDEDMQPEEAPVQPYPDGMVDVYDHVSHVESMPNCNQPVYESVHIYVIL